MKTLKRLLITLLLITIIGCRSLPQESLALPPKPERQEQKNPETLADYADLIIYYEYLVQDWENWGDFVTNIVQKKEINNGNF